MKEKLNKKELKKIGFSKEQINIIWERTNGKRSWLEFDIENKADNFTKLYECNPKQFELLKQKYPFQNDGRQCFSIPIPLNKKIVVAKLDDLFKIVVKMEKIK